MASKDMLDLADRVIREHLTEQCQRLLDGGYPDASIHGNFGTSEHDDEKGRATLWCNVNLGGLGDTYSYEPHRGWSLPDLEGLVTRALAEMPMETRRAAFRDKLFLAYGYLNTGEDLDAFDALLKARLRPDIYDLLTRNHHA